MNKLIEFALKHFLGVLKNKLNKKKKIYKCVRVSLLNHALHDDLVVLCRQTRVPYLSMYTISYRIIDRYPNCVNKNWF